MPILNEAQTQLYTSATAQLASVPLTEARPTGAADPVWIQHQLDNRNAALGVWLVFGCAAFLAVIAGNHFIRRALAARKARRDNEFKLID